MRLPQNAGPIHDEGIYQHLPSLGLGTTHSKRSVRSRVAGQFGFRHHLGGTRKLEAGAALSKQGQHVQGGVSDHVGAQPLAQPCASAKDATPHEDERHLFPSLVCVAQGKHDRLTDDADHHMSAPGGELLLEIPTEYCFLADAGSDRHQDPDSSFHAVAGEHSLQRSPAGLPQDADDDRRN